MNTEVLDSIQSFVSLVQWDKSMGPMGCGVWTEPTADPWQVLRPGQSPGIPAGLLEPIHPLVAGQLMRDEEEPPHRAESFEESAHLFSLDIETKGHFLAFEEPAGGAGLQRTEKETKSDLNMLVSKLSNKSIKIKKVN